MSEMPARLPFDGAQGTPSDRNGSRGVKGSRSLVARKAVSSLFVMFCAGSVLIALVPLGFILFFVVTQGIRSINLDFFLQLPKPVGEPGGGMANAIVGTLMVSGLAALMAVPIGVAISSASTDEYSVPQMNGSAPNSPDTGSQMSVRQKLRPNF